MEKGIIYVMSSCVEGLVKIGKTGSDNFEQRMSEIERNGYHHISVFKREFAIEVEDHHEKEKLLHSIFNKSRVEKSELFAVDLDLVKQLMSSMEGKSIYPVDENKQDVFEQATEAIEVKNGTIPDGIYTMNVKNAHGTMIIQNGKILIKKGALLSPVTQTKPLMSWMKLRKEKRIDNSILLEDVESSSPSMAASFICGNNKNGWTTWKNSNGQYIDIYRKQNTEE